MRSLRTRSSMYIGERVLEHFAVGHGAVGARFVNVRGFALHEYACVGSNDGVEALVFGVLEEVGCHAAGCSTDHPVNEDGTFEAPWYFAMPELSHDVPGSLDALYAHVDLDGVAAAV
eukprot:920409-Pyramimonas_sp.AAC.1